MESEKSTNFNGSFDVPTAKYTLFYSFFGRALDPRFSMIVMHDCHPEQSLASNLAGGRRFGDEYPSVVNSALHNIEHLTSL